MSVAAWLTLALSVPVLLLGEFLVRRVRLLERFSIPAPVAGGLVVALLLLLVRWVCGTEVRMETGVSARGWTWLVCAGAEWRAAPVKNVSQPFLVAFFACIGLNASWTLFRRGSLQILAFLAAAAGLAVVQNLVGAGLAGCMGFPRLLGLMCGSVALTGGHGTVMGFAPEFTAAGVEAAQVVGVSAATFGLVAGGLLGGPLGGALIRAGQLRAEASAEGGRAPQRIGRRGFSPMCAERSGSGGAGSRICCYWESASNSARGSVWRFNAPASRSRYIWVR